MCWVAAVGCKPFPAVNSISGVSPILYTDNNKSRNGTFRCGFYCCYSLSQSLPHSSPTASNSMVVWVIDADVEQRVEDGQMDELHDDARSIFFLRYQSTISSHTLNRQFTACKLTV